MHHFAVAALALRGLEHQHQVGRTKETGLVTLLGGEIAKRDRQVGLADARGSEEYHVLGALDEGKAGELHDLLARRPGGEVEIILIEGFDRWEARYTREQLACPRAA
jgi:hypothetical protein